MFSKIVVGVVEPDGVLKSVADKFCSNCPVVGSEPKFHATFFSVTGENRDGELSGVTVALRSEFGVETHPGVGAGDSVECGRPYISARSLQARNTPNWFSKKGTQSQSYLYRIIQVSLGSVTMSYG